MRITIGEIILEQTDGSSADDISFTDVNTKKEYSFDEYLELIKNKI
tara:strand:- start:1819 stop:1956 length:138 start_codon:yes stop_codon:yes gene_type:complete